MKIQPDLRLHSASLTQPAAAPTSVAPPGATLATPPVGTQEAHDGVTLSAGADLAQDEPVGEPSPEVAAPLATKAPTAPTGPQHLMVDQGLGGALFGDEAIPTSVAVLGQESDLSPEDAEAIVAVRQGLAESPTMEKVVEGFVRDHDHPMNVVAYLKDPESRTVVLKHLQYLAELPPTDSAGMLEAVEQGSRSSSPLLTDSGAGLTMKDGVPGPQRLREDLLAQDPELFSLGHPQSDAEWGRLKAHASRLRAEVLPSLTRELEDLVADMPESGGFPAVNARAKSADGIADKIDRMRQGNGGKAPRPGYCLADMPDAVGGRITVSEPRQLEKVMARLEERFGKDNIHEKDNFYANPSKQGRPYRCITYTIVHEGVPCEIQLTTLDASLVADLWHNTGYKPLHPELSSAEVDYVAGLQYSVTADEHRQVAAGSASS